MRSHLAWAAFLLASIACLSTLQIGRSDTPTRATNGLSASPAVKLTAISLPTVGTKPETDLVPEYGFERARELPGYRQVRLLRNPLPKEGVTPASIHLYEGRCASCHGPAGCGDFPRGFSTPPDLPDLHKLESFKLGAGDLGIFRTIKFGIPYTSMFPWKGKLTDRQIWDLVSLIRALQKTPAKQW